MKYEVEQKFSVADLADTRRRLHELGAEFSPEPVVQADVYFAHPTRDFAETDEAFRIRRVGDASIATYKGPKIDAETKTRRELEAPLLGGEAAFVQYQELFELLGFRRVAEVHKSRLKGALDWKGTTVVCDLDDVQDVGAFLELEIVCDPDALKASKECLRQLAEHLQLGAGERRSYLELLLLRR